MLPLRSLWPPPVFRVKAWLFLIHIDLYIHIQNISSVPWLSTSWFELVHDASHWKTRMKLELLLPSQANSYVPWSSCMGWIVTTSLGRHWNTGWIDATIPKCPNCWIVKSYEISRIHMLISYDVPFSYVCPLYAHLHPILFYIPLLYPSLVKPSGHGRHVLGRQVPGQVDLETQLALQEFQELELSWDQAPVEPGSRAAGAVETHSPRAQDDPMDVVCWVHGSSRNSRCFFLVSACGEILLKLKFCWGVWE